MTETKHSGCYICKGEHPQPETLTSGFLPSRKGSVAVCDHPDCQGQVELMSR